MIALLRLGVLCVVLAVCHGACFMKMNEAVIKDGKLMEPVCVDDYDKSEHPVGDSWNTGHCLRCYCGRDSMECCHRYGGLAEVEGCIAEVDQTTCEYKFYKKDDPSKPCFQEVNEAQHQQSSN